MKTMKVTKNVSSYANNDHGLQSGMIKISNLRDFSCHPFKVVKDAAMYELMESIRQEGVLVPLLVRPVRMKIETEGGEGKLMDEKEKEYEIIAGHRRKTAAEWAGLREVPAIVRDLDDDQAVIAMVDSNLQREQLLPSEKAYAYKMRLEAMKHQGRRLNPAMVQIEPKEVSSSIEKNGESTEKDAGSKSLQTDGVQHTRTYVPVRSNELLARQVGENVTRLRDISDLPN
jgi:ParB family chromosome partitioning protein